MIDYEEETIKLHCTILILSARISTLEQVIFANGVDREKLAEVFMIKLDELISEVKDDKVIQAVRSVMGLNNGEEV